MNNLVIQTGKKAQQWDIGIDRPGLGHWWQKKQTAAVTPFFLGSWHDLIVYTHMWWLAFPLQPCDLFLLTSTQQQFSGRQAGGQADLTCCDLNIKSRLTVIKGLRKIDQSKNCLQLYDVWLANYIDNVKDILNRKGSWQRKRFLLFLTIFNYFISNVEERDHYWCWKKIQVYYPILQCPF